jgi:hypothetical protein
VSIMGLGGGGEVEIRMEMGPWQYWRIIDDDNEIYLMGLNK